MKTPAAFTHARRSCHWCAGGFQPLPTLSDKSTEHFCSSECAFARHQAFALDLIYPGEYEKLKAMAVKARAEWSSGVAQRLREGREKAHVEREKP